MNLDSSTANSTSIRKLSILERDGEENGSNTDDDDADDDDVLDESEAPQVYHRNAPSEVNSSAFAALMKHGGIPTRFLIFI